MYNSHVKKPPFVGVPFEDIVNGKKYAFTFNPRDPPVEQEGVSNLVLFAKSMITMCRYLYKEYNSDCKLYIEYSKLGKLHVHGTMVINDKFSFYDKGIDYLMKRGTFCLKTLPTLDDAQHWDDYCIKQEKDMTKYLNDHHISHPIDKEGNSPLVKVKKETNKSKSIELYF